MTNRRLFRGLGSVRPPFRHIMGDCPKYGHFLRPRPAYGHRSTICNQQQMTRRPNYITLIMSVAHDDTHGHHRHDRITRHDSTTANKLMHRITQTHITLLCMLACYYHPIIFTNCIIYNEPTCGDEHGVLLSLPPHLPPLMCS